MNCFKTCEDEIQKAVKNGTLLKVMSSAGRNEFVESFCIQPIPYSKLRKATGNFGKVIGKENATNIFYLADLESGQLAAIEELKLSKETVDEFLAKVSIFSRLRHENFLQMISYCIHGSSRYLAYEYSHDGAYLHDILHGSKRKGLEATLSWNDRVKIAIGIAKGLEYLHENNTSSSHPIYWDIRSDNIIIFNYNVPKIINLELSEPLGPDMTWFELNGIPPPPEYEAPEYILTGKWTSKCDVFSFGVILLELLTGRRAFDRTLTLQEKSLVRWAYTRFGKSKFLECVDTKLRGKYPIQSATKFASIAAWCVQFEAELRPNMRTVVKALQHLLNA